VVAFALFSIAAVPLARSRAAKVREQIGASIGIGIAATLALMLIMMLFAFAHALDEMD
jgi:hypothetical protein